MTTKIVQAIPPPHRRRWYRFCFLLYALSLTSCLHTNLEPFKTNETALTRLQHANHRAITLNIDAPTTAYRTGAQFLLFFPLGSVYLADPAQSLRAIATEELLIAGFRLEPSSRQLQLQLKDLSLNAYDYLFVRNLRCHVVLGTKISNGRQQEKVTVEGAASNFEAFAFAPELTNTYEKCVREGVRKIVRELQ